MSSKTKRKPHYVMMIDDWKEFLRLTTSEQDIKMLQHVERTGSPLGNDGLLTGLEKSIGKLLKPERPGRKPKKNNIVPPDLESLAVNNYLFFCQKNFPELILFLIVFFIIPPYWKIINPFKSYINYVLY